MIKDEPNNPFSSEYARKTRLEFIYKLMFETPGGSRFTQDSPVLTNVWLNYALEPRKSQKVILTVDRNKRTGKAATAMQEMLGNFRTRLEKGSDRQNNTGYTINKPIGALPSEHKRGSANISYIAGQISAELYFDEMMRLVLPLTPWWNNTYNQLLRIGEEEGHTNWLRFPMPQDSKKLCAGDSKPHEDRFETLKLGLLNMRADIDSEMGIDTTEIRKKLGLPDMINKDDSVVKRLHALPSSLLWLIRIAGVVNGAFSDGYQILDKADKLGNSLEREFNYRRHRRHTYAGEKKETKSELTKRVKRIKNTREYLLNSFLALYQNWSDEKVPNHPEPHIWRVTKNRPILLASNKSVMTVKADAARRLFDISCKNITWAVIDSGIDASHPAFKDHEDPTKSRITKTFDFTKIREMLDYELILSRGKTDPANKSLYEGLLNTVTEKFRPMNSTKREAQGEAKRRLDRLATRMKNGQDIDWEDLEPLLTDENPDPPVNDHGTHVAGVLGSDWIDGEVDKTKPLDAHPRKMQGMCPDIRLHDVRVFRNDGATDEFELLAAVQFLRWRNSRAGHMEVQGANLSLSLIHEVRRFACGKTPICDECDESVALGMVMVAAAGNHGYSASDIDELTFNDGFQDSSITDPGNADGVITVGSTHRKRPYDYGVSYFSSRGPTGDGRNKPDLVAPGEKIKGPTPNEGLEFKDGTSMAAPHVSGAAAMLLARNKELIGKPQRIKQILCESASDLGREKYFQGHGLLDILRAMQSI